MDGVTAPHGPIWHGATVLVVDDEPMSRALIRRMLKAENFHVEEAEGGESALALVQARSEPFDLVLTDLSMPGIDGRQLSETLARYRPSVAILGMSGNPDTVPHIGPSDIPFRVMLKPFTTDDLYHAIRDAITRNADLAAVAEEEIVQAHAGLSRLARALEASRTVRVHTLDLVVAARELRRVQPERRKKPRTDPKYSARSTVGLEEVLRDSDCAPDSRPG
jgi:DNA-binding response OmpR family regulator